jgi:stress response protein SCP2
MAIALSPGANCPLPVTARIAVSVRTSAAHADVVALLLDGNGHADGDDGVVLFSHPVTAAGAVVLDGDTVTIEVAKLSGAVQRVLVVAQADGVTDMTACGATTAVVSGDGGEAARFELPAPPAMPTVQLVEIYRRDGAWKARALGDGYEAGLARLLTVHGVEVTDDPVEEEGPRPAPATARVDVTKPDLPRSGKVSLEKGARVTLRKDGEALRRVSMGLGWDPAESGRSVDLDASCVLLTARGKKWDAVWFMNTKGKNGAAMHSGDNLTGEGEGDDEVIEVDLDRVPAEVVLIAFTVNSFQGQPLSTVSRAFCTLRDRNGTALVHYDLRMLKGEHRGVVMATLERGADGAWTMTARGDLGKGRTYRGLMGIVKSYAS